MNATLVILAALFLYLLLIWKAGRSFPLMYLFAFTYFLQYVFAPFFIYNEYDVLSYQMPIDQETYFSYALPALGSLFLGVFLFMKDFPVRDLLKRVKRHEAINLAYLLLGISVFFDLIQAAGINELSSITSFTTYLKYVGAFCFLFAPSRFHYFLIGVIYLQLALRVFGAGVFISLFVWSTFLFFFFVLILRVPFFLRAGFILLAIPVTVLIQGVKTEYRKMTWGGNHEGGVGLFSELAEKRSQEEDEPYTQSKGVISTIGRLSQGWHLGMTLRYVPAQEPIAEGSEMLSDIVSSLLPRVIFSGKKEVNSQDKFYKYTGHRLRGRTSMSIGILGDFYVNFGWSGSLIMLFIFGAVLAKLLNYFYRRYVLPDPVNVIWIPFILSYLIRANNDFYIFFQLHGQGLCHFSFDHYASAELVRRTTTNAQANIQGTSGVKRVLVFYSHFLPAFKAGGPIQSIANMVELVRERYQIDIVCGARDLGEKDILEGIDPDKWNAFAPNVHVFYIKTAPIKQIVAAIWQRKPDIMYVNGVFLPLYAWLPMFLAKLRLCRVMVSPRGMLQNGAMNSGTAKKKSGNSPHAALKSTQKDRMGGNGRSGDE